MLNTNLTSDFKSVPFHKIFLDTGACVKDVTSGKIFSEEYFAKDWNSIYVKPSDLPNGTVDKGMRKITQPSLLITTKKAKMAYVLASIENPVYLLPESVMTSDGGYILSYRITPEILPEYIYYMCQFEIWRRMLNSINIDDNGYWDDSNTWTWDRIGEKIEISMCSNDGMTYWSEWIQLTPNLVMSRMKKFNLPFLSAQKTFVEAAIAQEAKIKGVLAPKYNVVDLINRYMVANYTKNDGRWSNGISLLSEIYRISAGSRAKQEVLNILNEYEFKSDILSQEELNFLSKHLNEVFALITSPNSITIHPSDGFVQPQEVTDFMCKIASFPEDVTVYNPFAGANSYAITLNNHVVGEELNRTTWALGQIRLFANLADKRSVITLGDSFESFKSNEKFKAIIASPVYLLDEGHEISDIVRMLYGKLEDGGKLACIVSANFLFRKDKKVRTVREALIKDKAIASVVMLPSNIFTGSSIAQAAILLTKGIENEEIHFGDASGHTRFAKSVYRATTFDLESFMDAFQADIEDTQEGKEILGK